MELHNNTTNNLAFGSTCKWSQVPKNCTCDGGPKTTANTTLWRSKIVPGLTRLLTTCNCGCELVYDDVGNSSSAQVPSLDPFALHNFDGTGFDHYETFMQDMGIEPTECIGTQKRLNSESDSALSAELESTSDSSGIEPNFEETGSNSSSSPLKVCAAFDEGVGLPRVESDYASSEFDIENHSQICIDTTLLTILEEIERNLYYHQLYAKSSRGDRKRQVCMNFLVNRTKELVRLASSKQILNGFEE